MSNWPAISKEEQARENIVWFLGYLGIANAQEMVDANETEASHIAVQIFKANEEMLATQEETEG